MKVDINVDIEHNILHYHHDALDDPNHRYHSWEHCYLYFQKIRTSKAETDVDIATLHLAFYLASWGMYRGSSHLLQKNYRVHVPVVREILDDEFVDLWQLDFDTVSSESPKVNLLFQLVEKLRKIYRTAEISPTDTLITKVLLGTVGCIPAYDRFFMDGIKAWQNLPKKFSPKFPATFGRNSYTGLIGFYHRHSSSLKAVQETAARRGINYPVMKLIDMYFWNLGEQSNASSKSNPN